MVKAFGTARQKRDLAAKELSLASQQNAGATIAKTMEHLATDEEKIVYEGNF